MKNDFLLYLLQAGGCMAVLYLLYRLLLRRETFFGFNRLFLLGGVAFSAVLPLIRLPAPATALYVIPTIQLEAITLLGEQPDAGSFDWMGLLVELYEIGVFLFAARLLYRLYHVWELTRQLPGESREGYRLLYTGGRMPTFSFFGWLFWDETKSLSEAEKAQVLQHELTHIRQRHSLDVLLMEIAGIFFWFNPFVHLFGKELRSVHEYLADREVVKTGDPATYLQLVAGQAMRGMNLVMIQPFHSPPLKNRIRMIRSTGTTRPAVWKVGVSLLTIAVLSLLYACRTGELIEPLTGIARFTEASPEFLKELSKTIKYPASARAEGITGTVTSSFVIRKDGSIADIKIEKGLRADLDAEVLRTLTEIQAKGQNRSPGTPPSATADTKVSFPFHFVLDQGEGSPEKPKGGVVVIGYGTGKLPAPPPPPPVQSGDVFMVVEQMPEFPGGMDGLTKYLSENLKYPAEARRKNVQGTVFVGFVVQADGSITSVEILKGIGGGLDAEASRVIAAMPPWQPGRQSDQPVAVRYSLPIRFLMD